MDKSFVVRGVDGSVDVDASVSVFKTALTDWVGKNEISAVSLEKAVKTVFAKHPGKPISTATLVSMAAVEVSPDPEQYVAVSNALTNWIKAQIKNGTLVVHRGKNGGLTFKD